MPNHNFQRGDRVKLKGRGHRGEVMTVMGELIQVSWDQGGRTTHDYLQLEPIDDYARG